MDQISSSPMARLSILLSTRNHARWLDRCLDGISGQSFRDFEFLICDDGSTDETPTLLEAHAARDNRIQLSRHKVSQGAMASYAELVGQAAGEFLWLTASDDFVHDPRFLERGFDGLRRNPHLGGFFANSRRVLATTEEWDGRWGWWGWPRVLQKDRILREFLNGRLTIPGAACVMARTPFMELGGYRTEVGSLCDLLAALELGGQKGLWFTGTSSVTIRVFPGGQSHGTKADLKTQLRSWARFEGCLRKSMPGQVTEECWLQWRAHRLVECLGQRPDRPEKQGGCEMVPWREIYIESWADTGFPLPEESSQEFQFQLNKEMSSSWRSRMATRLSRSLHKRMDRFFVRAF
jgi:hypothetical protein